MTQLNRIIHARGGKHPETDEEWAKYEADKAARRAKNVANAKEVLDRNDISFIQWATLPEIGWRVKGAHVSMDITYFPETGLWWTHRGERHFGVRNLVKYIKEVVA